ncbi:lysine-specific demethylase 4C-like [Gigantopelta aegis]|uniref:lysine-specific demethylase 4C-like n=1 Tax=Gigantopelta aegis TaxID=1735272 RepID=UPI001B8888B1|nr:lysine-specific demethylase 4C-like [Gigantopelta aegis]
MAFHMEGGIMVFTPTLEQFRDFPRFISYMEEHGAHHNGIAKIIPPKEWKPCRDYNGVDDFVIPTPVSQFVTGQQGVYQVFNIQKKSLIFSKFKEMANSDLYKPPKVKDNEELERKYWKNVTFNPPIYGADIPGSLYDQDVKEWNINHLGTILDTVTEEYGVSIPGGLNCAESTNFASLRWIEYGKKAKRCMCRKDMVQINMDVFVEKFQPEQWEEYCRKKESKATPTKHSESSRSTGTKHNKLLEFSFKPPPTKKSKLKEEDDDLEEEVDEGRGQIGDDISMDCGRVNLMIL